MIWLLFSIILVGYIIADYKNILIEFKMLCKKIKGNKNEKEKEKRNSKV